MVMSVRYNGVCYPETYIAAWEKVFCLSIEKPHTYNPASDLHYTLPHNYCMAVTREKETPSPQ